MSLCAWIVTHALFWLLINIALVDVEVSTCSACERVVIRRTMNVASLSARTATRANYSRACCAATYVSRMRNVTMYTLCCGIHTCTIAQASATRNKRSPYRSGPEIRNKCALGQAASYVFVHVLLVRCPLNIFSDN